MKLPKNSDSNLSEPAVVAIMDGFVGALREVSPLSNETTEMLFNNIQIVTYKAKETILDYGDICNYILFLVDGLVKSSFIEYDQERTVWFFRSGEIAVAVDSFHQQIPSDEKLITLQPSLCIAISKQAFEQIKSSNSDLLQLELKLIWNYYAFAMKRNKWLQFSNDEKLMDLERLYPKLFLEIPAIELARFLGISRQTLNSKRKGLYGRE